MIMLDNNVDPSWDSFHQQGSLYSWKIIEIQICFKIMEKLWKVLKIC